MRCGEAFVLGTMTGAVVAWLWGKKIEDRIATIRTRAADGIQAVEETGSPRMTVPIGPRSNGRPPRRRLRWNESGGA